MKRKIEVVPYSSNWPEMFAKEAKLVEHALGSNCIAIHHIGSTSVPGLDAKPIIDMVPVVKNIVEVDTEAMQGLGYRARGEYGIAFRRFFQKEGTFNVHIYEEGDTEIDRYVKFRDYLRSHEEEARSYARLKTQLASQFPDDIYHYCLGKEDFVAGIDAKDSFEGWRMVQALTDREWAAVRNFRLKYFFKTNVDPYTWTFEEKDHLHWVFYKNNEIIGYIHLQLWPEQRALLRIIVIDEPYRKLGYGSLLLSRCERWLRQWGYKMLMTQSSPEAYPFYIKQGYSKMPLNDPNGYKTDPRDIEMGKDLSLF